MEFRLRLSPQTRMLLDVLVSDPTKWRYGYDLSRETGLKSGTLYPVLMRLANNALLETRWETTEAGKPPRHMYRLTKTGVQFVRERLAEAAKQSFIPRPAFSGDASR